MVREAPDARWRLPWSARNITFSRLVGKPGSAEKACQLVSRYQHFLAASLLYDVQVSLESSLRKNRLAAKFSS